ncbi:MAG: ABC transporter permease, partial [Anaerolineae bacterium]|nr:ABC transporter permease [Anaerolineae bacterium]
MATATRTLSARQPAVRGWWVTPLVVGFGLLAAWWLLNLVIGGKCDDQCVVSTLAQALRVATPIAFAALCGVICERAGVVNIGIEGQMLMAAMVAYATNLFVFQGLKDAIGPQTAGDLSRWLALVTALGSALLLAALHAVVSIKFRADQIISGTVVNILAIGITGYFYRQFLAENLPPGPGTFPITPVPLLAQIPVIGPIVFQQKPLTYVMLLTVLLLHYVLFFTRWGLRTRAVGEHPRAADTLGINVYRTRYVNAVSYTHLR